MRTTLTIDEDVAADLEKLRAQRNDSFKKVVNDALRAGLAALRQNKPRKRRYVSKPWKTGEISLPDVDNVGEVMALLDRLEGKTGSW